MRASLAGLPLSRLRAWLPGAFAARLLRGVRLPGGRIMGETDRLVHLFPIPAGRLKPQQLRVFCGLVIRPGQAELVTIGTGMPCVACGGRAGSRAYLIGPPAAARANHGERSGVLPATLALPIANG